MTNQNSLPRRATTPLRRIESNRLKVEEKSPSRKKERKTVYHRCEERTEKVTCSSKSAKANTETAWVSVNVRLFTLKITRLHNGVDGKIFDVLCILPHPQRNDGDNGVSGLALGLEHREPLTEYSIPLRMMI